MPNADERHVTLSSAQAAPRALELTSRRFLTTADFVELNLLMEVIAGIREGIGITDTWLKVLEKHWYAPVSFEDPTQECQHEPYATYRAMADTVLVRLEQLACGEVIIEDTFKLHPSTEEDMDSTKRYLDSLLARAAKMVSLTYESPFAYSGEDLLLQLKHDAQFALRCHFAYQWFDGVYALGYAMMDNPLTGFSPFGGCHEQVAMMRSMAQAILDSLAVYNDNSLPEDVRVHSGHTVALFWPMLKSAVVYAAEDMNSPARGLKPGDSVIDLIEQALTQGKNAPQDVSQGLKLTSTGQSRDGQRVMMTPTADVIAGFRKRVADEAEMASRVSMIR